MIVAPSPNPLPISRFMREIGEGDKMCVKKMGEPDRLPHSH